MHTGLPASRIVSKTNLYSLQVTSLCVQLQQQETGQREDGTRSWVKP
jgi:hypothetical protein